MSETSEFVASRAMVQPPLALPLYARRPWQLQRRINEADTSNWNYAHKGVANTYNYYIGTDYVTSDQVVNRVRAEHGGSSIRILDIGCGTGGLVLKHCAAGHFAQGISLHDYRSAADSDDSVRLIPEDDYIVGNVENMHELEGLRDEYDVIVSRFAFMHLYEPLGTLEQVVDRLAPGGCLLIDGLYSPSNFSRQEYRETSVDFIHEALEAADIHEVRKEEPNDTPLMRHDLYYQRGNSRLPFRIPVEFSTS